MRKVAVVGCGGAGKSTLARRLGELLDLPVTHLDRLFWLPRWVVAPDAEFQDSQREAVAGERWIIDGNYSSSMHLRLPVADTVVFLDLPRRTCLRRALLRAARDFGQDKQAPGCPERLDFEFLQWIWGWRRNNRPRVFAKIAEHAPAARQILLTTRRETELFLRATADHADVLRRR